jgi:hypothetical protein
MTNNRLETAPVQFSIIMPWGRVGSNLLLNILKQTKRFQLANEPMTGIKSRNRDATDDQIARLQAEWFEDFFSGLIRERKSGGAKLSVASVIDLEAFKQGLIEKKLRMIYMDRRNLVKTAVSVLKAEIYAKYHEEKFGKSTWAVVPGREMKEKAVIDLQRFTNVLNNCRTHQQTMRKLCASVPGIELFYEDLQADLDGQISRTLEYLGCDKIEYEIPYVKAVSDNLQEEIANFQDLLDALPNDEERAMLLEV